MQRAANSFTALIAAAILATACVGVVRGDEAEVPKEVPKEAVKVPKQAQKAPQPPATPAQLAKWAKDLDSDEFLAREEATLKLAAAGTSAIPHVKPIVSAPSLEASTRALHVLREIGLSSDIDTQDAAREALEEIARQPSPLGKRATGTIAWLNQQRSSQTIQDLEKLGATVQRTEYSDDLNERVVVDAVQLGPAWKGDEKDLRRLKWLVDVRQLVLIGDKMGDAAVAQAALMPGLKSLHLYRTSVTDKGMQILAGAGALQEFGVYYSGLSDEAIKPLAKLPGLTVVKLYDTKITPDAKEQLVTALKPRSGKVDYRRGGFLGVGCAPIDGQCVISTVHMGSPADKAGLETGDCIVRFAGKELKDFDGLTAIIAEHQGGETIEIEILRGTFDDGGGKKDESRKLKVTLAEWDVDLSISGGRLPRP